MLLGGLLLLPACGPGAPDLRLDVRESELRGVDGTLLLSIEDVPGSIPVDADSEFGASGRFVEASASPDGEWLAVVTSGAAHSGGWLLEMGTAEPFPAAFQYGGGLTVGPWSADGRWVVFVHEGPAGDRTLSVAGAADLGSTVEESTRAVQAPDHDDRPPEARQYEPEGWSPGGQLEFRIGEEGWVFDPETGAVQTRQVTSATRTPGTQPGRRLRG